MQVQEQRGKKFQSSKGGMGRSLGLLSFGGASVLGLSQPLLAQPVAQPMTQPVAQSGQIAQVALDPTSEPLDIELVEQQQDDLPILTPGACTANGSVITSKTICQNSITIPSLWWLEEQYRHLNGKLLNTWLAYSDASGTSRRVDLVVNPQVWSLLDYLERYKFTDWFGATARDYGFSTRVFNPQGRLLAAYTCAPPSVDASAGDLPACRLWVNSLGRNGLSRPPQSAP